MTLRRKLLLSAIAFFSAVYILQLIISRSTMVKELKIKEEIDFISADGGITVYDLEKFSDTWKFYSSDKSVEKSRTDQMTEKLSRLTVLQTVSRNPDTNILELYGLADPLTVTARHNGKTIRKLIIGNPSVTGLQTYIQLNDDKQILLVQGNLREVFQKSIDELAEKNVYTFEEKEIHQITYSSKNENFILEKNGHGEHTKWIINGTDELDEVKALNWINLICEIDVTQWLPDMNREALTQEAVIEIYAADKKVTLTLYKTDDNDDTKIICSSSETPELFSVNSYKAELILQHDL